MRRVLAALVAVAMLSTTGSAALQHVHAYVDHDHADHHHGPASHVHSPAAHPRTLDAHAPDRADRLEDCDPGRAAVSVVFAGVAPQSNHVPVPATLDTIAVRSPELAWRHAMPSDVRAHSPPRLTDAPLRAPPVVPVV